MMVPPLNMLIHSRYGFSGPTGRAAVRRTAQGAPPGLTSAAVSPHHLTASRLLVEQTQAT
jgi:hypothetical protein